MPFLYKLGDLLEGDAVQIPPRLRAGRFTLDADEMLLEGYRPKGGVEVE